MPETLPPAEQTTPGLCIYLLGPPKVERAGRPLTIPRRQARALLFYLATRAQTVPRECLHFLFWPDAPESTARRSLTRLLTHLRRALPAPKIVLTTEEGIGLDPRRAWSDVADFERQCATQKPYNRAKVLFFHKRVTDYARDLPLVSRPAVA